MQATTIITPHEGSNKNEHFSDKLCVAHLIPLVYYEDFTPWIRAGRVSTMLKLLINQS